jgi:VCBS repeat-containing protein
MGSVNVSLTEGDSAAAISTSGVMAISDADSPATVQAQTDTAGNYGSFSINANGAWTYVANGAHNEFAAGQVYTDSFTVTAADGTTSQVVINIVGTNDAAVITPVVVTLDEGNSAADISSSGTLSVSDVDNPASFVVVNNHAGQYGSFSAATGHTPPARRMTSSWPARPIPTPSPSPAPTARLRA